MLWRYSALISAPIRLPEESLRTYISRVRKKLKELDAGAHVVNKSGKGYALIFKVHSG